MLQDVDDFYFSLLSGEEDIFPISDGKYADQLQLQEVIMSSLSSVTDQYRCQSLQNTNASSRNQQTTEIRKHMPVLAEPVESSSSFCNICMEKKTRAEMFRNDSCFHGFCSVCICKHIPAEVQGNVSSVPCPDTNCDKVLVPDFCHPYLPEEVFQRWADALCESFVLASKKLYCPYKDCEALLVDDAGEAVKESECPSCRRLFCAHCKVPWHSAVPCQEFQKLDANDRGKEDLMMLELAESKKWKLCPSCKFFVERTDGCLHMTCRNMLQDEDDFCFSLLSGEEDIFPVSDSEYAYQLQLQEAIMSSLSSVIGQNRSQSLQNANVSSRNQPTTEIKKLMLVLADPGESSSSFCNICTEKKTWAEMFKNDSCSHGFCSDCICKHIAAKVQGNVSSVPCPDTNCDKVLEPDFCHAFLPEEVFQRWADALCESFVLASKKLHCPYKDCEVLLVDDAGEAVKESECPSCRRLFCAHCKVPWHSGVLCQEFQKLDTNDRGKEDLMMLEFAKSKKWKRCPRCNFFVERTDGCLHMTCRCMYQFCYKCGSQWGKCSSNCPA